MLKWINVNCIFWKCLYSCSILFRAEGFSSWDQRLDTIKMWHSTYFPNVCVSVIFTYCQNGGYKKISDIIFAECHIFIVSNLWWDWYNGNGTIQTSWKDLFQILYYIRIILKYDLMDLLTQCTLFDQFPSKSAWKKNCQKTHIRVLVMSQCESGLSKTN
jgi:hypothetical protein